MPAVFHALRLSLALAIVALGAALPAAGSVPVTYAPGVTYDAQQQAIVNYMATTAGQNRAFLLVDPILTKVAQAQALDMAENGYFSDTDPAGDGPNILVAQAGYVLPSWWPVSQTANYIESIAAGESTAAGTWGDWMNSAPHREHLLAQNSFYASETSVGVGFVSAPGSQYGFYWVVITAPPNEASTVTIASPAIGASVTAAPLSVAGTTGGVNAPVSVQIQVKNATGAGAYEPATGTATWTATVTLAPGVNTLNVQSLDGSGKVLAETSRTVIYLESSTLTVSVAGNGTVTKGYLGTTMREVAFPYTITATPAAGSIFVGWSGSSVSASEKLSFVMSENAALTATFEPNPFLSRTGIYRGLLAGADVGIVGVNVGSTGAFTGRATVNGVVYAFVGQLAPDGSAQVSIPRVKDSPLVVGVSLDITGSTGITGTVTDAASNSTFAADGVYPVADGKFAAAGRYTIVLPPDPANTDPTLPQGYGVATLLVNTLGQTSVVGTLADGQIFSAAGAILQNGTLPVYVPLYNGRGGLSGTLTLQSTNASDIDGTLHWSKPLIATSRIQPTAIEENLPAAGSLYIRPAHTSTALPVSASSMNAELNFAAGNLAQPAAQTVTLETSGLIVIPAPASLPKLNGSINLMIGRFAGTFVHPVTHELTVFHGVVCQKANAAYGLFLGSSESGSVSLAPTP